MIELMRTTAGHVELAYRAFGQGPTLVLLHAFPLSQDMWTPQVEALAAHCHVITIDLPGFGASQCTDGEASLDTLAALVHDFLRVLGHEQAVIGGLSMGGYIALAYARKYPAHLRGLILADTTARPDTPEQRGNRLRQIEQIEYEGLEPLATSFPARILTGGDERLAKQLEHWIVGNSAVGVQGALRAMAERPDSMDVLPSIHVPTLVMVGGLDMATPPELAEEMVAHLPRGTFARIPQAGHLSNLENPQAFNAAVKKFMHQFAN